MELWKKLDVICLQRVFDTLYEYCVNRFLDSDGWHTVLLLTLVPKKGDLDLATNYRRICQNKTLN